MTQNFWADTERRYYEACGRGEHDDKCEVDVRGFWLCHCKKRARVAKGHAEPPGPLIYFSPSCPRCHEDVHHDGDGYVCTNCHVVWSHSNEQDEGTFTDDFEIDLFAERNRWLEKKGLQPEEGDKL